MITLYRAFLPVLLAACPLRASEPQRAQAAAGSNFATINYQQSLPPLSVEPLTNGVRLRFSGNNAQRFTIERAAAPHGPWTNVATRTASVSTLLQYDDTSSPSAGAFYRTTHTNSGRPFGPNELPVTSKAADVQIAYGTNSEQKAELRVPASNGPHPVVILIHGGCWDASILVATFRSFAPLADALKADDIATWNIEYRRLGQTGGGWPGTYQDVATAVDHLRTIAVEHRLDLNRVVVLGHSAGGHLAMWVAARSRLPKDSPLYISDPLPISGVINLAGTADMEAFIPFEMSCCGSAVVERMLGGTRAKFPERYLQSSAIHMLPLGIPQIIVWGEQDTCLPASLGENYTEAAKQAGDSVLFLTFPALGHFEIASYLWPTWPVIRSGIQSLLETNR